MRIARESEHHKQEQGERARFHGYNLADSIAILKHLEMPKFPGCVNLFYKREAESNMRSKAATILFAVVFAVVMISCGSDQPAGNMTNANSSPKTPPVPAATIDELASGKNVFETNCILCHKSDGTGGRVTIEGKNLNVEDLTTAKIIGFSDEKLIGYIMNGVEDEGMPAFKGKLSEGEMRDVVKHIRFLQKQ